MAERTEHEFRRWAAFFYPLLDDPETAEALCEIGLRVVRREIAAGAAARIETERILNRRPTNIEKCAPADWPGFTVE
jgi:hypothetical protein